MAEKEKEAERLLEARLEYEKDRQYRAEIKAKERDIGQYVVAHTRYSQLLTIQYSQLSTHNSVLTTPHATRFHTLPTIIATTRTPHRPSHHAFATPCTAYSYLFSPRVRHALYYSLLRTTYYVLTTYYLLTTY